MNYPAASYGVPVRRRWLAREKSWHNLSQASLLLLYERCKQRGITPKEIQSMLSRKLFRKFYQSLF